MKNIMTIRKCIREQRRLLSPEKRHIAEESIYKAIKSHKAVQNANHVAIFLSFDGEVNTQPIIQNLWEQNKSVYLPVCHPFVDNHLLFLKYTPQTQLIKNAFDILEPRLNVNHVLPYQKLDVIFTPLVAFDERGYRIGMGKGYYDRLLAHYQDHQILPIGLAFQCQKIEKVKNQDWDIKLPDIIYA